MVKAPAAGIAHEGPGPRLQIRDPLGSITLAVQGVGEAERQHAQVLSEGGVLESGFEAPLHQELENAPGLETRGVAKEEIATLGGLLEDLDEKSRRVVPLPFEDGLPLGESTPALRQLRLVDPGLGVSDRVLRVEGKGAGKIVELRAAIAAPGKVPQDQPALVVERQHEFGQDIVIRVDLHALPPAATAGSSR